MHILWVTVIVFFLFSLSGSAQTLILDKFSIKANGEVELIAVAKNGSVAVNGKPIGVLRKEGTLLDLNGKVIAKIETDGKFLINGKPFGLIDKAGVYDNGSGKTLGWTNEGKFLLSDASFFTISPASKKFFRTGTFLIFTYLSASEPKIESPVGSAEDEALAGKFAYRDSDLVASISRSPGRGGIEGRGYSIRIFGDGRIVHAGESVDAKKAPADKKARQAKINRFLQRASEVNLLAADEKDRSAAAPFVHDGISVSTGAWINGGFREIICGADSTCDSELSELHKYFVRLFADEMSKKD